VDNLGKGILLRLPKLLTLVAATITTVGVLTVTASPGNAATTKPRSDTPATGTAVGLNPSLRSSITTLDPYVSTDATGYTLNAPVDVLTKIPAADLSTLQANMADMNKTLRANGVHPMSKWTGPHGYVQDHWYGWEFAMDGWLAAKIMNGIGAIGGVSGLAKLIAGTTAPEVVAIIGVVATLMAAAIKLCQKDSGWVWIYWINLPPPGSFWCNPL